MHESTQQEKNKATYRRFIQEVFNEGRAERVKDLVVPNYVLHDVMPGTPEGSDAIIQGVTLFRGAFSDFFITLDALVAEGDWVCARATSRGVHSGTFLGIPATGRAICAPSLTMVRIVDGRVCESWVRNDVMGIMTQLKA